MPFTAGSSSRAVGYVVTAANWNELEANVNYLIGTTGKVVLDTAEAGITQSLALSGVEQAKIAVDANDTFFDYADGNVNKRLIFRSGIDGTNRIYFGSTGILTACGIISTGSMVVQSSGEITGSFTASSSASVEGNLTVTGSISNVKTGTYVGDNAIVARHMNTGFLCRMAFITNDQDPIATWTLGNITNSLYLSGDGVMHPAHSHTVHLTATTGFDVADGDAAANSLGVNYYWVAYKAT